MTARRRLVPEREVIRMAATLRDAGFKLDGPHMVGRAWLHRQRDCRNFRLESRTGERDSRPLC